MDEYTTKFFDSNQDEIANMPGLLNVTLFTGMEIRIHGYDSPFKIVSWSFVHDHEGGLRINLESIEA